MARTRPRLTRQETEIALGLGRQVALLREIGSGAAATMFRGVLKLGFNIERPIAVKVYDELASDDRDRVIKTMATAARGAVCLRHPNIAQILEFGVVDRRRPFLFEELVEGPSLEVVLKAYADVGARLPLDLALFIGVELAEALEGARGAVAPSGTRVELVHGDLSAREVLLTPFGEVKVTDFGIDAAARAASSVRTFASVARRATALAPEVVAGEAPSARADVFSVGVLLWRMLVGPRFPEGTDESQMLAYAHEGYVHSTVFDPLLPSTLKAVLRRALEVDPSRRFEHGGALAYELRRISLSLGVGDGRVFLRHAVRRMNPQPRATDSVTNELTLPRSRQADNDPETTKSDPS